VPSERTVGLLLTLVAITAAVLLMAGVLKLVVAP